MAQGGRAASIAEASAVRLGVEPDVPSAGAADAASVWPHAPTPSTRAPSWRPAPPRFN